MITEAIKRTTLALLCTASFALGHAQIQTTWGKAEIEVGGTNLRLGMTKAQVAEKLVGQEITKWHEDEWMLGPIKHPGPLLQFTGGASPTLSASGILASMTLQRHFLERSVR
jgi:hypothetical protein